MIELYGGPMSSSGRTHWMLEEIGVPYEYKRIDVRAGQTKAPEYLRVYAGGKIPALRDGDTVLGESMAINFYLAEKYRPELMPSGIAERAQVYQWSFWSITNLQPDLLTVMFDGMKPPEKRDAAAVDAARTRLAPLLGFLEQSIAGHEYLVANRFTVADVNAGSVVNLARGIGMLASYPSTHAWMERLASRPAYQRASKD
jgi:glutathione S-transferase